MSKLELIRGQIPMFNEKPKAKQSEHPDMRTISLAWRGGRRKRKSGDRPSQIVHCEHTTNLTRAGAASRLGSLTQSDGTQLEIEVRNGRHGQALDAYGDTLTGCIEFGTGDIPTMVEKRDSK